MSGLAVGKGDTKKRSVCRSQWRARNSDQQKGSDTVMKRRVLKGGREGRDFDHTSGITAIDERGVSHTHKVSAEEDRIPTGSVIAEVTRIDFEGVCQPEFQQPQWVNKVLKEITVDHPQITLFEAKEAFNRY